MKVKSLVLGIGFGLGLLPVIAGQVLAASGNHKAADTLTEEELEQLELKPHNETVPEATGKAVESDNVKEDAAQVQQISDRVARSGGTEGGGQGRELTIERSFSITHVKVPKTCELDTFKSTCTRLVNYYARRFEREMVSNINLNYDESVGQDKERLVNSRRRIKSIQRVNMSIYSKPGDPILTMFSVFRQRMADNFEQEHLLVETINFEADTGRAIQFRQLFGNPELAAMLCARAIEARYARYESPLLPVVISATELSPSNFIITPKGLRFFFAPNLVKPNTITADSMLVPIEQLRSAQPVEKWWSTKDHEITKEEREALARSSLSGVINLDEDFAAAQEFKTAAAAKQAEQDAAAIKGKSVTDAVAAPKSGSKVAEDRR